MDRKQWENLTSEEQNKLSVKFGVTRSGESNSIIADSEFDKIPNQEKNEVKTEARKLSTKKSSKGANRKGIFGKSRKKSSR